MGTRPDDDLAGCGRAHATLLTLIGALDDATARRSSLLPGWTVGHTLTHLARNADGIRGTVEAAARGEVGAMYPGGMEQRNGDIEAGAGRPAAEIVADVRAACAALDAAWGALGDDAWASGVGRGPFGERPVALFPFTRWRETQLHTLDLGLYGFGVGELDGGYVAAELPRLEAGYRERTGGEPPAAVADLTSRQRLAWYVGRFEVPGVEPAGPWS